MTIIIEIDKRWAGVGFEILDSILGVRLGFIALHIIFADFQTVKDGFSELKQEGGK